MDQSFWWVDLEDKNIRIAPTACDEEELHQALEIFVTCICLANLRSRTNS